LGQILQCVGRVALACQAAFEMRDKGRQITARPVVVGHPLLSARRVFVSLSQDTGDVEARAPGWTRAGRWAIAISKIVAGGNDAGYGGNGRTAGVRQELHR